MTYPGFSGNHYYLVLPLKECMKTILAVITLTLCCAFLISAGCTGTGTPSAPAQTPGASGGVSPGVAGGAIVPCTIASPAAGATADNLEILNAQGETMKNDVLLFSGKVRNNGGERAMSGMNGRSCDTITGRCAEEHVAGVILEPYETVDINMATMGGCPTSGTAQTCTCEVWFAGIR